MSEAYFKLLAAVAPAVVLAIILIKRDPKREPIGWLLFAVLLGVLCGPGVLLLVYLGLPDFAPDTFVGAVLSSFISAAIPEECLKFLALWVVAKSCRHFDEYFDGIVYAVCIGMGFAGLENILYLFGADDWIVVGISRALLSVPAHYVFAVVMGAFFALGWFDRRNRRVYMTGALLIPIIIHGIYDVCCFTIDLNEYVATYIQIAFLCGFIWIRKYVKRLTDSFPRLDEQ